MPEIQIDSDEQLVALAEEYKGKRVTVISSQSGEVTGVCYGASFPSGWDAIFGDAHLVVGTLHIAPGNITAIDLTPSKKRKNVVNARKGSSA